MCGQLQFPREESCLAGRNMAALDLRSISCPNSHYSRDIFSLVSAARQSEVLDQLSARHSSTSHYRHWLLLQSFDESKQQTAPVPAAPAAVARQSKGTLETRTLYLLGCRRGKSGPRRREGGSCNAVRALACSQQGCACPGSLPSPRMVFDPFQS